MEFKVTLPDWVIAETEQLPECIPELEERMRTVIRYSRLNVEHQTGGPFAAGVFEKDSGKVVAIGVNRVVPASVSSAHAEIVTLSLAQQKLQTFDLGGEDYAGSSAGRQWSTLCNVFWLDPLVGRA